MSDELAVDVMQLEDEDIEGLSDDAFLHVLSEMVKLQAADRRENNLLYYQPASPACRKVHQTDATYIMVAGGNGSSKSETCLVELIACCTGVIPLDVPEIRKHFRGPINTRVVVESLTTTLHNIILPKLQWWKWTGVSEPGGDKGHWGWIPKLCLKNGSWENSWSEKTRTLTLICRDPGNFDRVMGESTIQFMSHEQDPTDFASGDYHFVLHDEPTKHAIWVENQARTMRANGRMFLAMTWPDEPAIPVDWIYDELYELGSPGPRKRPTHEVIELDTRQNRNLDQTSVQRQAENWSAAIANVRLGGKPIRFSNRIHPLFTDTEMYWSFKAGKVVEPRFDEEGQPTCPETGSYEVVPFCHVRDCEPSRTFPTVFIIDPHPRKPHMFLWAQIDPADDYTVIIEGELDGTPTEVSEAVHEIERANGLQVMLRLMDPNMGLSPSSAGRARDTCWQDEFTEAGLRCDLASDSDVGRQRINEYLQPDRYTERPRLTIASPCVTTQMQMKRYCWDDHKRALEKDLKQTPKAKHDDFPTMMKYLLNYQPTFRALLDRPQAIRRTGERMYGRGR